MTDEDVQVILRLTRSSVDMLHRDAADEIERVRAEAAQLRTSLAASKAQCAVMRRWIERQSHEYSPTCRYYPDKHGRDYEDSESCTCGRSDALATDAGESLLKELDLARADTAVLRAALEADQDFHRYEERCWLDTKHGAVLRDIADAARRRALATDAGNLLLAERKRREGLLREAAQLRGKWDATRIRERIVEELEEDK